MKLISIPILFSLLIATEYQLPDEQMVSEHFRKMKQLREEIKMKQKACTNYGNPDNVPTSPVEVDLPRNERSVTDTFNIPINYHLIYVGGDSVYMNLQVDNVPYEHCMWDIWSYDNNTFLLYPGFGFARWKFY